MNSGVGFFFKRCDMDHDESLDIDETIDFMIKVMDILDPKVIFTNEEMENVFYFIDVDKVGGITKQ